MSLTNLSLGGISGKIVNLFLQCSLEASFVQPHPVIPVDPIKIDLLDPDPNPYSLSKIQKSFWKKVLYFTIFPDLLPIWQHIFF
jgi:hypothetical protein